MKSIFQCVRLYFIEQIQQLHMGHLLMIRTMYFISVFVTLEEMFTCNLG